MKKFMASLKKFYNEHRIFVILMAVVIVCFILILIFLLRYFYFGVGEAPSRLCSDLKDESKITSTIKADDLVTDSTLRVSDKSNVIFITIKFTSKATIAEAQSIAVKSLDNFTDEEKECYDIEYAILAPAGDKSESYTLMGSVNASGSNIIWTNNN